MHEELKLTIVLVNNDTACMLWHILATKGLVDVFRIELGCHIRVLREMSTKNI